MLHIATVNLCIVFKDAPHIIIGYEPAGLTVHPPPQNDRELVHFFLYGCLVPPKLFPKKKVDFVGDIKR